MKHFNLLVLFITLSIEVFSQSQQPLTNGFFRQADSLFMLQQWKTAIPVYEKLIKEKSDNSMAWNRLGFCYHNTSEYNKAITCYQKSIECKPASAMEPIVNSRLARAYAVTNEKEKSMSSLEKAIQVGYVNLFEMENESDFKNVNTDTRYLELVDKVRKTVYPCLSNVQARQFDFWIGEWDAYVTGTNTMAGNSKIQMASGGCMILENWSSYRQPFEGKSMNYVDSVTGKWKQVWVGSQGINVTEFLNGEYRDNAMRFEYETKDAKGNSILVHFHFYNQGPDQVRQLHQTSADAGKTWITTYDFTYKRKH